MTERDLDDWRPWDLSDNWGPPREGATRDPADAANWRLGCRECALMFPTEVTVGVLADHWTTLHHPEQEDEPEPELNLVWVGLGAPPPPDKAPRFGRPA